MKLQETAGLTVSAAKRMLLGGNLASLSLIATPRLMLHYVSECISLQKIYTASQGIPQKCVYEVLLPADDATPITLGVSPKRPMTLTPDLVCLCLICRLLQPKVVFEIGTFHGHMAYQFALNTTPDCRIYTLDLPRDQRVEPRLGLGLADSEISDGRQERYFFEGADVAPKITTLFGDSATFDFSPFHGRVDFFFIDGAHSYDYVRLDTLNALQCCHHGSVIAWHDFGKVGAGAQGVSRWIVELSKQYDIYTEPRSTVAFMRVP